jgi:hypothetical protein
MPPFNKLPSTVYQKQMFVSFNKKPATPSSEVAGNPYKYYIVPFLFKA